jgi:hypothetical protein
MLWFLTKKWLKSQTKRIHKVVDIKFNFNYNMDMLSNKQHGFKLNFIGNF